MTPEPEKRSTDKRKILPLEDKSGITYELKPSDGEKERKILFIQEQTGRGKLLTESVVGDDPPVRGEPTIHDLRDFQQILRRTDLYEIEPGDLIIKAELATSIAIVRLQFDKVLSEGLPK